MRSKASLLALAAVLIASPAAGQTGGPPPGHYYDVDKEVRFEGTVREVVFEPRYKGTAPFLVLRVEEAKLAKVVIVEVSPSWFFREDIHSGEKVKGIGSLSETPEGAATIIARQLQLRGRTLTLRDKRGFPNWQGGPQGRRGIRRFGGF
ncbi:MAG TPA: hypothetical protein VLJ16_05490 [Acidobacteriota bacterium]|nr:hypothetical protein [Acidobacteriota bacterium]